MDRHAGHVFRRCAAALRAAFFLCALAGVLFCALDAAGQGLTKTRAPAALDDSGAAPAGVEDLKPDESGSFAPPPGSHYGVPEELTPDDAPAAQPAAAIPQTATGTAAPAQEAKPQPPPGADELIRTNRPAAMQDTSAPAATDTAPAPAIEPQPSAPADAPSAPLTSDRAAAATPAAAPAATAPDALPAATPSTTTTATPAATAPPETPDDIPDTVPDAQPSPATAPAPVPAAPATGTEAATGTPSTPSGSVPDTQSKDAPAPPKIGPVQITGFTEIISQNASVSGGSEYHFLSQNGLLYFDKFRQRTHINLEGELDNGTVLTGEFVEMPYLDRVFRLEATHKRYKALIGDTSAEFESGPMTSFRKQIRGLDLYYDLGSARLDVLFSKQKSRTQSQTFVGRNVRGPYALRDTGLVENTEVVRVNGQPVPRSEYTIDYFMGQITFNRVMDPGDTIEVNYESEVWLDLRTGNLFGVTLQSDFMQGRASAGVSFLREETDVLPQAKVFSESSEASKQNLLDADTGGYVFYLGQTRLEKNHELITARATDTVTLRKDTDYFMDYASGVVTFATGSATFAALPGSATITVVFNYYDQSYVQWVQDEELSGDGEIEYMLSYERIYGGTEYAAIYINGAFVRQLIAGVDYEISEGNNSIVFLDAGAMPSSSFGRTVRISYEIVPGAELSVSDVTAARTVQSVFGEAAFGAWKVSAEAAQSASDLRLKTVPVVEEIVGFVTDASQTEFLLRHQAMYNSVEIYFNDVSAPSARQTSGSDFVVEYDAATDRTRIRFKRDIPLGTTIIANYKFQSSADYLKSRDGKAGRLVAEYDGRGAKFRGEFMKKSPLFTPVTAYNDLENERVFATLSIADIYNFSLDLDYARQTHYQDLASSAQTEFDKLKTRLGYSFGDGHSLAYTMETHTRQDNLAARLTDTSLSGQRVDAVYRVNETMSAKASYEMRDIEDGAGRAADRDVQRGSLGLNWRPSQQLQLDLTLGDSALRSAPPESLGMESFTIRTLLTQLNARYLPSPSLSVNINMDKQNIEDTREDAPGGKLDNIRAEVFGKGAPFSGREGVFKEYLISYYRQDRPDLVFGDSRTDVSTLRLTLRAGAQLMVIPSFTASKSLIGTGSRSRDNTAGVRVQYRDGATVGWRAAAGYSSSARSGRNVPISNPSAATTYDSDQTQISLFLDYMTGDRWSWSGIYQNTASSGTGNFSSTSYTSKLNYLLNDSSSLRLVYNLDQTAASGDRTTFEAGAVTRFDKNMDLDVEYKTQDQTGSSGSDYNGTLFTMKLRITF